MSVFHALSEEHALLLSLVGRLERASDVKDARALLLVLLRALEAHENLEHLIFDEENEPAGALAHVERQHGALGELRAEALELLQSLSSGGDPALRGLVRRLSRLLRSHFQDEERILWPLFNASAERSRFQRLARIAAAQLVTMKKELHDYRIALNEYLT
jgi:hypothetical protein